MTRPAFPPEEPPASATQLDLGPLLRHLIAEVAGTLSRTGPPPLPGAGAAPATAPAALDRFGVKLQEIADGLVLVRREMHQRFEEMSGRREAEEQAARQAKIEAAWQEAVFGPDLTRDERIKPQRQTLIEAVLRSDPAALGLAGHLMVFQSASPDRIPNLLKDLGEAYYRWRPRKLETDLLEQTLVDWLGRKSDAAGLRNRLELVDPGCRFNSAKHRTAGTGVEVVEVQGWVVLRADGVVFHKAGVTVR